jgi:hypothetical protein
MVALLVGPALAASFLISLLAGKMALQLILGSLDRGASPVPVSSRRTAR